MAANIAHWIGNSADVILLIYCLIFKEEEWIKVAQIWDEEPVCFHEGFHNSLLHLNMMTVDQTKVERQKIWRG